MIYLQRLVIRQNKVIQDLTLEFEGMKPMTVFIGENGSGKTTILESLTAIFAALHQRVEAQKVVAPAFDFELWYWISEDKEIEGTSTAYIGAEKYIDVRVLGERNQPNTIRTIIGGDAFRKLSKSILPNIVIYYPGSSDTLLHTYQRFTDEQEKRLRTKATSSVEAYTRIQDLPVFYYQKQHFDMLLSTLLSFEYSDDIKNFFGQKLRIELVSGVPIVLFLKRNQFRKGAEAKEFWGADGEIKQFLEFIRKFAIHKAINEDEQSDSLSFSFTLKGWYQLREQYADEKTLFLMLNALDTSDLLAGFNIAFKRNGHLFPHFFLSEGERQLIITKGLSELLFNENTLFLLDEPNVFMHPSWQSSFMDELNEYTERASFIITTHSPIILSNIRDGHLIRMTAGQAEPITGHYYGRVYSDNLEDLLGTPARPTKPAREISELFDLLDEEKYEEAEPLLITLKQKYGDDDADLVRAQTMLNFYQ